MLAQVLETSRQHLADPCAKTPDDKARWRKLAATHLAKLRVADAHRTPRGNPRQQRVASYRHLVVVDAALLNVLGFGIKQFQAENETQERPRLLARHTLVLMEDQAATNLCTQQWLLSERYRLLPLRDDAHRLHNDCASAVRRAGYGVLIKCCELVCNLQYGPWGTMRFGEEVRSGKASFLDVLDDDDPLLASQRAHLEHDLGLEDAGAGFTEMLRAALEDADFGHRKGPHLSTCRWLDYHRGARWLCPQWSLLHSVLAFIGLEAGWLRRGEDRPAVLEPLRPRGGAAASSSAPRPETTKAAKAELDTMRDRCKNSLHVACAILSDRELLQHTWLVVEVQASLVQSFNTMQAQVKGRAAALQHHADMALGVGALEAARGCLTWVQDRAVP